MGNRWVSMTDPSLSAGAPLAWLPGAAVALAVLAGAAVPDEPPHAATSAAVILAPRQARSTRRAPPLASVIVAENSLSAAPGPPEAGNPRGACPRSPAAPDRAPARSPPRIRLGGPGCARGECCAVNYRWRGGDFPEARSGYASGHRRRHPGPAARPGARPHRRGRPAGRVGHHRAVRVRG